MLRFALAGLVAAASLALSAGCTIAAPEEEPEQQRLLGGEAASKPAPARTRRAIVACCFEGERFECPDEKACHAGFDESACIEGCSGTACVVACTNEARGRRPDSTCTKVGPCT